MRRRIEILDPDFEVSLGETVVALEVVRSSKINGEVLTGSGALSDLDITF